ncbi:peroxiredoxin-like family protein [Tuwongella immobilis]|uniref:Alkyl hydroperoxide reductase subunit C/ Thiol specific antioxidant domain-containing protein n=1 Tax=Tuwongella immobilis TaxID=692036 RepID=A0A6C2YHP4_9BACT|nr:peroxiredoxin-like family protein [Tuwongella immobilis]VIP01048.1 Alkyl hydroperoxide reductase/ Thiol specific antioxidant/ Mal allergen OS=Isosphaera pallida (strain ATCC 43644 / DSM 9630 / IS1B) GN=Isop_1548 PE=4 SV=1: AhpC-TSA_2 [Tuwongella immobilis]VTR97521.1 Alkyl hydroperoxide reductase/ Thiol specific antioxidant/ Mal allergen OS=Isosphaera pallida (strain ATCC 43644 / DSM 9630 / IS1B) GN=Isop_1548 PE=4 SV=1: AhpC-TSA_2 [Tuwongella immobilis]
MPCQAHLVEVCDALAEFEQTNTGIVVVCMSGAKNLQAYLGMRSWPVPVFGDPERKAYSAMGLQRTNWGKFFLPSVLWRYLRLMWSGWKVKKPFEGEDLLQLGGDFLIDQNRILRWSASSPDPTERPSIETLLNAIRAMGDSAGEARSQSAG